MSSTCPAPVQRCRARSGKDSYPGHLGRLTDILTPTPFCAYFPSCRGWWTRSPSQVPEGQPSRPLRSCWDLETDFTSASLTSLVFSSPTVKCSFRFIYWMASVTTSPRASQRERALLQDPSTAVTRIAVTPASLDRRESNHRFRAGAGTGRHIFLRRNVRSLSLEGVRRFEVVLAKRLLSSRLATIQINLLCFATDRCCISLSSTSMPPCLSVHRSECLLCLDEYAWRSLDSGSDSPEAKDLDSDPLRPSFRATTTLTWAATTVHASDPLRQTYRTTPPLSARPPPAASLLLRLLVPPIRRA